MTVTLQPTAPPVVAPTGWGRLRLVLVLGALIALGPLTIDMYLPALPTIVDDLETTSAAVQLTLTGTLVGLALGQLLVGPLSDTFGRRRPLLAGVGVHVLASLLILVVVAAVALPETLPPARRRPLGLRTTLRAFRGLLRDRTFVGLVLVAGLAMSGLFGYVAGSSFVFQEEFGLNEQQFGLLFGVGALFLIGATQLNAALLRRFEPRVLLPFGLVLAAVAGAVLLVLAATGTGGIVGVVAPLWTVLFAVGLVLPNAPTLALARHGEAAGTASALLGATQMGVGAIVSPLVGVLGNDAVAMGAVMTGGAVVALVVLVSVVRPWTLADTEN